MKEGTRKFICSHCGKSTYSAGFPLSGVEQEVFSIFSPFSQSDERVRVMLWAARYAEVVVLARTLAARGIDAETVKEVRRELEAKLGPFPDGTVMASVTTETDE